MGRPSKLTDEKIALIRKRLLQDMSIKDIAIEAQVSESTVKRYKKSLPPVLDKSQIQAGDDSIKVNYTTLLTKREEENSKKIKKMLMLYDDPKEGWVWHLAKGDYRLKTSGRWWRAVVYPDSAPPDWIEKLRAMGYKIAISPLHDKDWWTHDSPEMVDPVTGEVIPKGYFYKEGDRKKAHWHVIIVVDVRVGFTEINSEIQRICHCPYIQRCTSLRGSYEYFLHINDPEKYQKYDKDEIQKYNGFQVELTKTDQIKLMQEMIAIIDKHDITEWCDCVQLFNDDFEFVQVLSTKTAYFSAYVKSRYYKANPNIVRQSVVKLVNKFDFEKEDEV